MPGAHLDAQIFQCFRDVGGCDVWTSSYHNEYLGQARLVNEQWWDGWHNTSPFHNWHLGQACQWFLIGHEKWSNPANGAIPYMTEAYYNEPNPSTSRWGSNLTPVGHWHVQYNSQGHDTYRIYNLWPLAWEEEDAFLNCGRQGKHQHFCNSPG